MTSTRFSELNLSRREDVGERDPMFRAYDNAEDLLPEEDVEEEGIAEMPAFSLAVCPPHPFCPVELLSLGMMDMLTMMKPERIHALLTSLIPPTLTFTRKPIHTPAPEPLATFTLPANRRSPLLAHHDPEEAKPAPKVEEVDTKAIFGSVSTGDILAAVKASLTSDPEAIRIPLEARGIRFIGEEGDRVKSLGEWEVEIAVPGASELVPEVQFVRRRVEVLPVEEAE